MAAGGSFFVTISCIIHSWVSCPERGVESRCLRELRVL